MVSEKENSRKLCRTAIVKGILTLLPISVLIFQLSTCFAQQLLYSEMARQPTCYLLFSQTSHPFPAPAGPQNCYFKAFAQIYPPLLFSTLSNLV